MKKCIALHFALFLFLVLPSSAQSDIENDNDLFKAYFGAGMYYYGVSDPLFQEVYKTGNIMLNGGFSVEMKKFEIRAEVNYFSKKGHSTLKSEPTTLTLLPIVAGLRYKILDLGSVTPYIGAGADYFLYKESVPESFGESVSGNTIGFHGEAGLYILLKRDFDRLIFDINFRYTKADAQPFEETVGLGGFGIGASFKVRF